MATKLEDGGRGKALVAGPLKKENFFAASLTSGSGGGGGGQVPTRRSQLHSVLKYFGGHV